MTDKKYNIALRIIKEMHLNYEYQYPKKVLDSKLFWDIFLTDVVEDVYKK